MVRPLCEFKVDDDGIYYEVGEPWNDGLMIYNSKLIIPKDTFIEAYKKYILEENHVDKNTEQTKDH